MRTSVLFSLLASCISLNVCAQARKIRSAAASAITIPAEFPGGQAAMLSYFEENLRYPKSEARSGKSGYVTLILKISSTGKVNSAELGTTVMPKAFVAEAMRVAKAMPNWTPATRNGKPVADDVSVDVYFDAAMAKRKPTTVTDTATVAKPKNSAAPSKPEKPSKPAKKPVQAKPKYVVPEVYDPKRDGVPASNSNSR